MTDSSSYLSGKTPISEANIIAENNLRKELNLMLQAQRDVGTSNIDSDLSLLPLPDNPPSFSISEQIIAAFTLLSPTSKTSVSIALNKTKPPPDPNPAPKFLFDVTDKLPCSSTPSLYHLDTHRLIIDLAEAKCYLPLTLFTANAMQCLYQESGSLKLIKSQHPITKTTVHVIDTSFGDKKDMDTVNWLKAISCYLVFLKQCASPKSPLTSITTSNSSHNKTISNITFQLFLPLTSNTVKIALHNLMLMIQKPLSNTLLK
ncbi:hypothetical protein PAXRUDRAFT_16296 [Paxillus rubicundulus Ve08.2h10]|uniref:Uncharacterized protein n=1 Tax=Paxillus rubicundulus Ve08.2h10 TaxID=930991 RepID=A0A0D0D770_9AGAM|nr:hypothetical protein PAXRUDRAFT_16296 [Paxillus rubicundulus Ve08.2h10]